jgi:hypothetical protein
MLRIQDLLKIQILKKNTNVLVFFVLFSFLFGNLFGLNSQIILINSSGFLFFIFPLIIEILNFLIFCLKKQNYNTHSYNTCLIFISIRRGFFLGIFLEAFKLGS